MTNEEKANQLVELTHHYETGLVYMHTDRVLYENLIEIAEWKEQQMIEKAEEWIEKNFNMPNDWRKHFIKAMEE